MTTTDTSFRPDRWVGFEMSPELRRKLANLHAIAEVDALNDVLLAAAMPIVNSAQQRAPVQSGTLRRSITVEVFGPGDVRIGSSVPYARRIEFGFLGADRLGREYHQAAQPYLRPAFEEHIDRVRRAIIAGARAMMREALGMAG